MDHHQAPFLEALNEYHSSARYGFTPPGHRQGSGVDKRTLDALGRSTFQADILSTGGLDDRKSSGRILERAEQLMADCVGAEQSFFSTCGSSLSVKAAMLAVAGVDQKLLLPRDVHKSVVAGLIFAGIQPCWIEPRWDPQLKLSHPPGVEAIEQAWQQNPDAAGLLIVSPSPYGTCADLATIARICHRRGKPLIVDEAWGAHLPFHEKLPQWAMDAGADICVVSVHKMGAGFEQGSVFHSQGNLIDPKHLAACADLLMTTSPSAIVYAGLDGWRRNMVLDGRRLLGEALALARQTRIAIDNIDGLRVLESELLSTEASHDLDRLQVLIDVSALGASGYQFADWLRENRGLDLGLSDHSRVLATLSHADSSESCQRLIGALGSAAQAASGWEPPVSVDIPDLEGLSLEVATTPREAFFSTYQDIAAEAAVGRIAAEQLTPYPPGIPAVVPGEVLNQSVIDYLRSGLNAGMVVPDAAASDLATIRVVQSI